jgi:hypothetical protein
MPTQVGLRAELEDLSGLQCLAAGSGPARSLPRDAWLRNHAQGRERRLVLGGKHLQDISRRIIPFFERFPLVGQKAQDFERFRDAVAILERGPLSDSDYRAVLAPREGMNRGGKEALLDGENPQRLYAGPCG